LQPGGASSCALGVPDRHWALLRGAKQWSPAVCYVAMASQPPSLACGHVSAAGRHARAEQGRGHCSSDLVGEGGERRSNPRSHGLTYWRVGLQRHLLTAPLHVEQEARCHGESATFASISDLQGLRRGPRSGCVPYRRVRTLVMVVDAAVP